MSSAMCESHLIPLNPKMENCVTCPPWKLIFQKGKLKSLLLIAIGILAISTVLAFSNNSCGLQHIQILNDISVYEETLDPEFCAVLVIRIDAFNYKCMPEVEILDCG